MSRFLLLSVFLQLAFSCNATEVFLSQSEMSGSAAFFPVKRVKLQKLIDEINLKHEVKLYLPTEPVMQHALQADEHVLLITFGREEAISFTPFIGPDDKFTTRSKGISIGVPFLSTSATGAPKFCLLLKIFRLENGGKHVIDANVALPTEIQHVDQLVVRDNFLSLVDGDLVFEIQERVTEEECTSPRTHDVEDVNRHVSEFTLSLAAPDFGICQERPDLKVDYCNVYRDHASEIASAGSNVCEFIHRSDNVRTCSTTFEIIKASQEMRELLLLEDGTRESIEAVVQNGVYDINMKFPCIAQPPTRRRYNSLYQYLAAYN